MKWDVLTLMWRRPNENVFISNIYLYIGISSSETELVFLLANNVMETSFLREKTSWRQPSY